MSYYYGECKEYVIVPEQVIPEREADLCLCLIASLYKFLHPICINISDSKSHRSLKETIQINSPKNRRATLEHDQCYVH